MVEEVALIEVVEVEALIEVAEVDLVVVEVVSIEVVEVASIEAVEVASVVVALVEEGEAEVAEVDLETMVLKLPIREALSSSKDQNKAFETSFIESTLVLDIFLNLFPNNYFLQFMIQF